MAPPRNLVSANPFAALATDNDFETESVGQQTPPRPGSPPPTAKTAAPSTPSARPRPTRTVSCGFDWADNVEEELAADQAYRSGRAATTMTEPQHQQADDDVVQEGISGSEHTVEVQAHTSENLEPDDQNTESQSLNIVVIEEVEEHAEVPQGSPSSPLETIQEEAETSVEVKDIQDADVGPIEQTAGEVVAAPDSASPGDVQADVEELQTTTENVHENTQAAEDTQPTSSSSSSGEEHVTGDTSPVPASSSPSITAAAIEDDGIPEQVREMDAMFGVDEHGHWICENGECTFMARQDYIRLCREHPSDRAATTDEQEVVASGLDPDVTDATIQEEKKEEGFQKDDAAEEALDESEEELAANLEEHWLSNKSSCEDLKEGANLTGVAKPSLASTPAVSDEQEVFRAPPGYAIPPVSYATALRTTSVPAEESAKQDLVAPQSSEASISKVVDYRIKIAIPIINFSRAASTSPSPPAMQPKKQTQQLPVPQITITAATVTHSCSSNSSNEDEVQVSARPRRVIVPTTQDADGWVVPGSRKVARVLDDRFAIPFSTFAASKSNDDEAEGEEVVAPMPGDKEAPSKPLSTNAENDLRAISLANRNTQDDKANSSQTAMSTDVASRRKNRRSHAQRKAARRATQAAKDAAVEEAGASVKFVQDEVAKSISKEEYLEAVLPDHLECLTSRKHGYMGAVKVMATGTAIMVGTGAFIVALIKAA